MKHVRERVAAADCIGINAFDYFGGASDVSVWEEAVFVRGWRALF